VFTWPKAVVIRSSRSDVVAGFDPTHRRGVVDWIEGHHNRSFVVAKVEVDTPELFRFIDKRGDWFELRPMTLELYETQVRPHTVGKPTFETLEALLKAMANEW
jgi:hypothetical protein